MKYLVLYERANGDIIYRFRKSRPQYEIGSYTSMGWKLLDIKIMTSGKAYSQYDYSTLTEKRSRVVSYIKEINYLKLAEALVFLSLLKIYM